MKMSFACAIGVAIGLLQIHESGNLGNVVRRWGAGPGPPPATIICDSGSWIQTDAPSGENLWLCLPGSQWVHQGLPPGILTLSNLGSCQSGWAPVTDAGGHLLGIYTPSGPYWRVPEVAGEGPATKPVYPLVLCRKE